MANPLSNEAEIFNKIKIENIKVDRIIWELINHYLNNDLQKILFIVGDHLDSSEPIPMEDAKKIRNDCVEITKFLKKLKEATRKD